MFFVKENIDEEKLVNFVKEVLSGNGNENEVKNWIRIIQEETHCPQIANTIFWNNNEMTPEQIIKKALKYKNKNFSNIVIKDEVYSDYWDKPFVFKDFIIDGVSLYNKIKLLGYKYVPCLGWGVIEFQKENIERLILNEPPDLSDGKYSLLICPCSDIECGCIAVSINRINDMIVWDEFEVKHQNITLNQMGPYFFKWEEYKKIIESSLVC